MTLEEKFNVEIADEQAELLKTVGDVISFIKEKKKD
jgi:acyl carrier protein